MQLLKSIFLMGNIRKKKRHEQMLSPKSITEMERCEIKNSIYHFLTKKGV